MPNLESLVLPILGEPGVAYIRLDTLSIRITTYSFEGSGALCLQDIETNATYGVGETSPRTKKPCDGQPNLFRAALAGPTIDLLTLLVADSLSRAPYLPRDQSTYYQYRCHP